jgi:hypothetical protein
MRSSAILIALLCLSGTVSAQRWFVSQKQANTRVVGLLNLPDVTRNFSDDACQSTESVGVQLYGTPSNTGVAVGAVYKRNHPEYGCGLLFKRAGTSTEEELPSEESGYDIAAAVVYERRGRWFRIAIPEGSAWIERPIPNDFLPYPLLLSQGLAYLRDDWDGQLRQTAGFGFPTVPLPIEWKDQVPKQVGIEVLGMTRVGSDEWIHIRFSTEMCGDTSVKTLKPMQGWIPAYRMDGRTTAWFYSRGC